VETHATAALHTTATALRRAAYHGGRILCCLRPLPVARCSSQGSAGQGHLDKVLPDCASWSRLRPWAIVCSAGTAWHSRLRMKASSAEASPRLDRYDCVSFRLPLDGPCVVGSARQRQRWSGRSASHAFCSTSSVRLAKTPAATTYSGIDYYSRLQTTARNQDLLSSTSCSAHAAVVVTHVRASHRTLVRGTVA
jgi:hypothetical protein